MGRVTDNWTELEKRHRVRYSVSVRFHENDLDRLRELVLAASDDHELNLTAQQGQVIYGRWTCEVPECILRERYDTVTKILEEAGLRALRRKPYVGPGIVWVAPNPTTSRLCRCQGPDAWCQERVS